MPPVDTDSSPSPLLTLPEDPESFQLGNQVCFALYSASLAMTKAYGPLLGALGLTYPQYLVMLVLWEEKDLTAKEIGKRLYLDSGTLAGVLRRLEQAGFVGRQRGADDERRVLFSLTESGCELKCKIAEVQTELACRSDLSLGEMIAIREQVSRLRNTLLVGGSGQAALPRK